MAHHIFQLESELQNIPEAAPQASRSFSVSEKLARYGSSTLSGVEHLTLLDATLFPELDYQSNYLVQRWTRSTAPVEPALLKTNSAGMQSDA
jgi:hypothetical protein